MRHKLRDRCWEYMRCGEEKACPAYPDHGEECWFHAGTMSTSTAERRLDFIRKRAMEEGKDMDSPDLMYLQPMKKKKRCKFIERYGMCQCCPYYQYMERMKRQMGGSKNVQF
ncbi:MAG: hypothetical protein GY853_03465 [PVC group bacterium]|nr:hypothetical protein [PVC group bacterium]